MPTYQYSCTECGHFFEIFQSFSDDSLTVCPQCSGRLRKVFNAVGVVFKGSGFYRTDSRPGDGASGSSEKPAETTPGKAPEKVSDSGTSTTTKTEKKPAAKAKTSPSASTAGPSASS